MQRIYARLAIAALASAGLATATGLLAPWWPAGDMPNHFTPLVFGVAIVGLALVLLAARAPAVPRRARFTLGLGLAGVAAINAVPLVSSMATAAFAAPGRTDTLTVVSFNVFTRNGQLDEVARWLVDQNADVIVLQEMTRTNREPIKRALAATHPHVHDCNCNDIVMFSRRPWLAAGGQPRSATQPPLSWMTLAGRDGREVATPDIGAVSFRTGPFLGSDHLPVVATVALP